MDKPLRIIVCLKQVSDPEAPASSFKTNSETKAITADGVPPVINPYDENALELALRIKDSAPETHITAVSAGPKLARAVLMRSLAVGADELHMIEGLPAEADGMLTAHVLAAVVAKMDFNIVLAGRQSADANAGFVGPAMAQILNIPAVAWARNISIDGESTTLERVTPDGYQVLKCRLPLLATVSHEAGQLRMPKLADMRKAKTKPIHTIKFEDIRMDYPRENSIQCIKLEPPKRQRTCKIIEADTPAQAGEMLGEKLFTDGVIN